MYQHIWQIKQANKNKGGHWFDGGAVSFFRSRVHEVVYPVCDGAYFVTSEDDRRRGRKYSVRFADGLGNIETPCDCFYTFPTRSTAHTAAKNMAREHVSLEVMLNL